MFLSCHARHNFAFWVPTSSSFLESPVITPSNLLEQSMVFTCCWLICLCLSQKYPWAYMVELASDPIFLRLPTCPSPAILIPVLCVLIRFAMLCFPSPAQLNRFCFVEPLLIPVPSGGSSFVKPRKAPASNLSFFLVFFQASFQSPACWITKTTFVWEAQRLTQGKAAYVDLPTPTHPTCLWATPDWTQGALYLSK